MSDWLVVCTAPRKEARVEAELARAGYETLLPTETRWVRHARWKREVSRPLMPGYLFAAVECLQTGLTSPWTAILRIDGVRSILGSNGRPTPVEHCSFAHLQHACRLGLFDETAAITRLPPGSPVRIISGPLMSFAARLKAMRGPRRVQLIVGMMGKDCSVTLPIEKVRAL